MQRDVLNGKDHRGVKEDFAVRRPCEKKEIEGKKISDIAENDQDPSFSVSYSASAKVLQTNSTGGGLEARI